MVLLESSRLLPLGIELSLDLCGLLEWACAGRLRECLATAQTLYTVGYVCGLLEIMGRCGSI